MENGSPAAGSACVPKAWAWRLWPGCWRLSVAWAECFGAYRLDFSIVRRSRRPDRFPIRCFIRFTCRYRCRRKRRILKKRLRKQRNRIPRRTGLCSALPATVPWVPSMTPGTDWATSRTWWEMTTAYPLAGVKHVFAEDDFTFVNLECALTDADTPADKTYRFRGLPAYGRFSRKAAWKGLPWPTITAWIMERRAWRIPGKCCGTGNCRRRRWGDLPLYHGPRLEGGRLYRLPSGPYTDSEGDYILAGGRSRSGHCSLPFRDRGFLYAYGEPEEFVPLCY